MDCKKIEKKKIHKDESNIGMEEKGAEFAGMGEGEGLHSQSQKQKIF